MLGGTINIVPGRKNGGKIWYSWQLVLTNFWARPIRYTSKYRWNQNENESYRRRKWVFVFTCSLLSRRSQL